jgi:hypothetical protein
VSFLGLSSLGPLLRSLWFPRTPGSGLWELFLSLILGVDLVRSRPGSGCVFSAVLQFIYVSMNPAREFSSEN